MKKLLFSLVATMVATATFAQYVTVQTGNKNLFDGVSVTAKVGASSDLTKTVGDLIEKSKPQVNLVVAKQMNPYFGLQAEGGLIKNNWNFGKDSWKVYSWYVGANTTWNVNNIIFGYKGYPRTIDVDLVYGFGYRKGCIPGSIKPYGNHDFNNLPANGFYNKTGVDLTLNIGAKNKQMCPFAFVLSPAVVWDFTDKVQYNCKVANVEVTAGVKWYFKNSNGKRIFKNEKMVYASTYDGVVMENAKLKDSLAQKPKYIIKYDTVYKTIQIPVYIETEYAACFAQNKSVLTEEFKTVLNHIPAGSAVKILATASPEGSTSYNVKLSADRAQAVKDYLESQDKGIKVIESVGIGAVGPTSQRVAIVKIVK